MTEAIREIDLSLVLGVIVAVESLLALLWVPWLFESGVTIFRLDRQSDASRPTSEGRLQGVQEAVSAEFPQLAFERHGASTLFFRAPLRFTRSATPLVRGIARLGTQSGEVHVVVKVYWWCWLLIGGLVLASWLDGGWPRSLLFGAILFAFVFFETRFYRKVALEVASAATRHDAGETA